MPQDVFEEYAEDYDRWFDEHHDEYLAELARIREVLPLQTPGPSKWESVQGGLLHPWESLSESNHPGPLVGWHGSGGLKSSAGRAEALPFRDGSCSSVLMVTVLCFLDNPDQAFQEIQRVLVPQGTLAIGFIEREGHIARRYLREKGKHRFLSLTRFYSHDEVRGYLCDTGFRGTAR